MRVRFFLPIRLFPQVSATTGCLEDDGGVGMRWFFLIAGSGFLCLIF